jgi:hypothetical protein
MGEGRGLNVAVRRRSGWVSDRVTVCAGQRPDREGSSPSGARMRGAVCKGGGNASLAEASGRYGDVETGTQAKAGDGQDGPGATARDASEDRVPAARRDPKGMRRSTGP